MGLIIDEAESYIIVEKYSFIPLSTSIVVFPVFRIWAAPWLALTNGLLADMPSARAWNGLVGLLSCVSAVAMKRDSSAYLFAPE